MHIPDAAISPMTAAVAGGAMAPVWWLSARRLRGAMGSRQVSLLALGAAFCFVVMMFNVPAIGGTTVHPIGGVLAAILLGPWAAAIAVTVALLIQALFFADGGVLALGANAFAMAFAMPFTGYLVYRAMGSRSPAGSARRAFAAGIGAYVGLNAAALTVAVLLGVQPWLHHEPDGRALYFPFDLRVTVPAIMLPHLLIAGPIEAIVTVAAVRAARRIGVRIYGEDEAQAAGGRRELAWVGLGAALALTPLGLLASGDAWGEWSAEDLTARAGYLPPALGKTERSGWKGFNLMPDYFGDRGPAFYVLAGLMGAALTAGIGAGLARAVGAGGPGREEPPAPTTSGAGSGGDGELPDWMAKPGEDDPPSSKAREARRSVPALLRTDFLSRSIEELARRSMEALALEEWSRREGWLQRRDPRSKVLAALGIVIVAGLSRSAMALGVLGCAVLVAAVVSHVPLKVVAARVAPALPLLAVAVAAPATLSLTHPGRAVIVLWSHPTVAVTTSGLWYAAVLLARASVAVGAVALLVLTTRWSDLLGGLRGLWAPGLLTMVLALTYRYLAVLLQVAAEVLLARRSRTVGRVSHASNRQFVGAAFAGLFGRAMSLGGEVHAAMVARGWTGTAAALTRHPMSASDWSLLVAAAAVGTVASAL